MRGLRGERFKMERVGGLRSYPCGITQRYGKN